MSAFPSFEMFFRAVTGHGPLPWQSAVAEFVEAEGKFPDAITVQTGLGKTSAMIVHVHALARDVHLNGPGKRTFALRCFHAVERRVVVDAAADLAEQVAAGVNGAHSETDPDTRSVLVPVHDALAQLIPAPMRAFEPVVATATLHGARSRDRDWLRPVGAQLVTATLTQVASRVLFRGVGVSQTLRPMDAAVTGMDRVILVDEPHLSGPAITALREAEKVQLSAGDGIGVPVGQIVLLGATAPEHLLAEAVTRVGVTRDDMEHPVAGRRLRAPKHIEVMTVPGSGAAVDKKVYRQMAAAALEAHRRDRERGEDSPGGEHGVLVFCNTVPAARAVFEAIQKHLPAVRLVHGRMRLGDRSNTDLQRGDVTVATQTLEVGADFDGVEVISQIPSLAALIQRAGRCNRYGLLESARVLLIAPEEKLDPGTLAVYGERAEALHAALLPLAQLEGGIPASPMDLDALKNQLVETTGGVVLDPAVRTARLRPEVARYAAYTDPGGAFPTQAFLYGPDRGRDLDVTVAWREPDILDVLDDIPVLSEETVAVPLPSLLRILERASGERVDTFAVSDLDAGVEDGLNTDKAAGRVRASTLARTRIRRAHGGWVTPASPRDIAPGMSVVLDAGLGGYTDAGLDETCSEPVTDLSEALTVTAQQGRFLLRDAALTAELAERFEADARGLDAVTRVKAGLSTLGGLHAQTTVAVLPLAGAVDDAGETTHRFVIGLGSSDGTADRPACHHAMLHEHGEQVGSWAAAAAAVLPLPRDVAHAIAEAGYRHDDGKADPRFQRMLGNMHTGAGHPAWAKSKRTPTRAEEARRREQSGLPSGWRHEVASVSGIDDPLTRHIVISHHYWGRPLIRHRDGDGEVVHTGHVETFDALTDKYGPWALALAETVMRWADHRASAHPLPGPADLAVKQVAAGPLAVPAELLPEEPAHRLALPGLTASPLAGVLAAVGLLVRVREELDPAAVLRWDAGTGIPEIGSTAPLRESVLSLRRAVAKWESISEAVRDVFDVPDGAKKSPVPALRVPTNGAIADPEKGLRMLAEDHLLWQLLPDTAPLGTDKNGAPVIKMECAVNSNNSSAFNVAFHDAPTTHFFDTSAGFENVEKGRGSGGVDIARHSYPGSLVRWDTLAWALDGYLALGWAPRVCATVTVAGQDHLTLPRPSRWTTPAGYRALAAVPALSRDVAHSVWKRCAPVTSDKLWVWDPVDLT